MLEKFLKTVETQKITKKEQKNISGENFPLEVCGEDHNARPIKC